ncbi:MAG: trypsin-like peptidase domain-containing protein [Phycisphaerae bacterium]
MWALFGALAGLSGGWAAAQDMSDTAGDHIRRATVLVLMEMPGTRSGGSGTGAFINATGLVVTNNHVVDPNHGKSPKERARDFQRITTPKYQVIVDCGTETEKVLPATLLHQSESADLALLQVNDKSGQAWASRDYLTFVPQDVLGENTKVWIFGYPGGLSRGKDVAITSGLITNLVRTPSRAITYIETDATANPGNSGGPMVDVAGRLLGVVTHKRFETGAKDHSGAVPPQIVQQFIAKGFKEGRLPTTVDVLPFVDIFTDHNGMVAIPTFPRDETRAAIHFANGNVRLGRLKSATLKAATVLGTWPVPLDRAAYAVVQGDRTVLVMDGGDKIVAQTGKMAIRIAFGDRAERVKLSDVGVVAFAKPSEPVSYPTGQGLVLLADGNRFGLADVEGTLRVSGTGYSLGDLVSLTALKGHKHVVQTVQGERLEGSLKRAKVKARTPWASKPIRLKLGQVQRASIRPLDWGFVNARGRRLGQQLVLEDDDIAQIADVLEEPDWQRAGALLEEAVAQRKRSREGKQQLKLLTALQQVRAGQFDEAGEVLHRLGRKGDPVGRVAQAYATLLERYPDGQFAGASLSEPDTIWRASSEQASQTLADIEARIAKLDKLAYRKKAKELKALEHDLDTVNRLEIGCAQNTLMGLLEKAYFAHIAGYNEMRQTYNETVAEHNRQPNRTQQHKFRNKLKSIEGRLKKTRKEIERLYERLLAEAVGFSVAPPAME